LSEASLEKKIVAAALKSRDAFTKIEAASNFEENYSPFSALILKLAGEYFASDSSAQEADANVLEGLIRNRVPAKSQELHVNYLRMCAATDVSATNIAELVLETKQKILGHKLASALLDGASKDKIKGFLEQYTTVEAVSEKEEEDEGSCGYSIEELVADKKDEVGLIKLLPLSLNEKVKGRAKRGHHIVLLARPETGKTAAVLTMMYGFAFQGLRVIHFGNEEPLSDVRARAISCFTGLKEEEIAGNAARAQAVLDKKNWGNVRFISLSPGTPKQIENYVKKYKPDVIVVDQIRNLNVGAETRVNQLEMAATAMRNIGKRYDCMVVSVTQAGDSASNKLVLDLGDVDFSNTGIPATADVMIGIGVNEKYELDGLRMFSLPKNKVGGNHDHFAVRLNREISRYEDL
jgi:KaiC/GvpD/RAD55 family RecA-like ATPase